MVVSCPPVVRMVNNDAGIKRVVSLALVYFAFLATTNLVFMMLCGLWARHTLYILKEVEYFLVFLLAIYVFRTDHTGNMRKLTKVLIIANLIYGLHQVMTGQIGYYGIRSIVTTAPSACGSVYFTAAILMLYFYYSEDRVSNLCIAVIMFVLAILTISRTYVFASCMFILVLAGMNSVEGLIRKRKVKIIRVAVLSLSIAVAVAACLSLFIASDSVHSKNTLLNVLQQNE